MRLHFTDTAAGLGDDGVSATVECQMMLWEEKEEEECYRETINGKERKTHTRGLKI